MRPVAAPDEPLRRCLYIGTGDRARVGIGRRPHLGIGIGAGQLDPGLALINQCADLGEQRMADAVRLGDVGKVVEHDRRRQLFDDRHDLHDRGRRGVDLDMPAKIVDPL